MKKRYILIIILSGIAALMVGFLLWYNTSLKSVSNDTNNVVFVIEPNTSAKNIINNLKDAGLIKNKLATEIYLRLKKVNLKSGSYNLNKAMSVEEILATIDNGLVIDNSISVIFREGLTIDDYAKIISKSFNYKLEDVLNKIDDKEFVKSLIPNYWFLTDSILNDQIYHPLEGYLYPDTYKFDKDASIEQIINKMLNNTLNKLKKYQELNGKYSIHEYITLASIIEKEGNNLNDRLNIAGVFYNRLDNGMSLGSDVTAHYGVKKPLSEEITQQELDQCNPYNTRGCVTKIPVGPICSPSIESIEAAINPQDNDYFYFVSDKNGKIYFSKTQGEQLKVISTLKSSDLWYNY